MKSVPEVCADVYTHVYSTVYSSSIRYGMSREQTEDLAILARASALSAVKEFAALMGEAEIAEELAGKKFAVAPVEPNDAANTAAPK